MILKLLSSALLSGGSLAIPLKRADTIKLDVWLPTQNATVAGPLSPYLVGFSLEPAFITAFINDFLGNQSTGPNELIINLLSNIEKRVGGLGIRIGGATADSAVWNESVEDTFLVEDPNTKAIYGSEIGPGFFDSLKALPPSTVFNMDLNLANSSYEIALAEAKAAREHLGSQLTSFSVGNEPDIFTDYQRNLTLWNKDAYYVQWTVWARNLTRELGLPNNFFRCGEWSHTSVSYATPNATIRQADVNPQDMIDRGVADLNLVKNFAFHFYPESSCNPALAKDVKLSTFTNHGHTVDFLNRWAPQVNISRIIGSKMVFGESNSVSCAGGANVSSTFGTGLWISDVILYAAGMGAKGMYSHNGGTLISAHSADQSNTPGCSWYDFAYPESTDRNGPARATAIYPAFLLVAEAIGLSPSNSLIAYQPLPELPEIGTYVIWDSTVRDYNSGPARIVIINFGNSSATVDLGSYDPKEVKRLTGGSISSTDPTGVSWAGQNYISGQTAGDRKSEGAQDGKSDCKRRGSNIGVLVTMVCTVIATRELRGRLLRKQI